MATMVRLKRGEQVERNREQLLAAARAVFLERGFHAASLDAIAEAAGFSKGVVYSQFASKADLFLALLERRIDARSAENARIRARGAAGVADLIALGARRSDEEFAWTLLVLEFRVHAARDPELNRRYAELHARTVERLAATFAQVLGDDAASGGPPPESRALFLLALAAGITLETAAATPRGLPRAELRALAARALALGPDRRAARRSPATTLPARRTR
jgi:AcrR family transcriptional regulator